MTAAGPERAGVAAWSVHLPGVAGATLAPGLGSSPAEPAGRAHELLGRKGLLYKDEATRLALCAVHRLLRRPPRAPRPAGPPDPRTAVVASCNLGNVGLVREVTDTVRARGGHEVSPLQAPNASSNVVASAVGMWFRWGGPNLLVCSGERSGFDALAIGGRLLRANRAEQVVVVGCEPSDPVAAALYAASRPGRVLRAAAAAVLLRPADHAHEPIMVLPEDPAPSVDEDFAADTYGARGVLELAVTVARTANLPCPRQTGDAEVHGAPR
ncbi:beta-ketoacyl synthase N-terminal-like domain-containing protein [Amycolatopsis sp. NPDC004079]|uniref:beta-ketoacyl synthase N-terminal-like domain-containing protein n=1 Tax=Amycolatopsis sp. NPDC004079 TaxID=3154549 RepID=UPI0033A2AFC1